MKLHFDSCEVMNKSPGISDLTCRAQNWSFSSSLLCDVVEATFNGFAYSWPLHDANKWNRFLFRSFESSVLQLSTATRIENWKLSIKNLWLNNDNKIDVVGLWNEFEICFRYETRSYMIEQWHRYWSRRHWNEFEICFETRPLTCKVLYHDTNKLAEMNFHFSHACIILVNFMFEVKPSSVHIVYECGM